MNPSAKGNIIVFRLTLTIVMLFSMLAIPPMGVISSFIEEFGCQVTSPFWGLARLEKMQLLQQGAWY